jgi:signal transduction histidine kinase
MLQARVWKRSESYGAARDDAASPGVVPIFYRSPEGVAFGQLEVLSREVKEPRLARRALEDAEARSAHVAYLMAAAGHDLRQQLQVISMALDRMAPALLEPRQLDWLKIARGEVASLGAALSELAIAARLAEPEPQLVRLAELVTTAVDGWRHHAVARGLRLRVREGAWTVRSDPRLLLTILRNLIGNAVQHTSSGGVLVACRRRRAGVTIDVIDSGPGLPEVEVARLFEPHRRGTGDGDGLGLGLALVRDAAERLGCLVSVRSTAGRGSCFSLTIPDRGD